MHRADNRGEMPEYLRDDMLGIVDRPIFIPTAAQLTIAAAELDFKKVKQIQRNRALAPPPHASVTMGAMLQRQLFINAVDSGRRTLHAKPPPMMMTTTTTTTNGAPTRLRMLATTVSPTRPTAPPPSAPASTSSRSVRSMRTPLVRQLVTPEAATDAADADVDADATDADNAASAEMPAGGTSTFTLSADVAASCVKALRAAAVCGAFVTKLSALYGQAWGVLRGVVERWRRLAHRLTSRLVVRQLVARGRAKKAEGAPPHWAAQRDHKSLLQCQQVVRAFVHVTRARHEALQRAWLHRLTSRRVAVDETTCRVHAAPALRQILQDARKRHIAAAVGKPTTPATAFTQVHDVQLVLAYVQGRVTRDINVAVATMSRRPLLLFTDPTVRTALDTLRREVLLKLKASDKKGPASIAARPNNKAVDKKEVRGPTPKGIPTPKQMRQQYTELVREVNLCLLRRKR